MPPGSEDVLIVNKGTVVMESACVTDAAAPSVTLMEMFAVPAVEGVPEIVPVGSVSVRAGGCVSPASGVTLKSSKTTFPA